MLHNTFSIRLFITLRLTTSQRAEAPKVTEFAIAGHNSNPNGVPVFCLTPSITKES